MYCSDYSKTKTRARLRTVLPQRLSSKQREFLSGPAGRYAAGDVTAVPYKQIVIASDEGSKALSAFDHLIRSPVAA